MDDINKLIHDVRNPLNSIAVNAELGKLTLQKTEDIQRAIEIFDVILNACRNCSNHLAELRECLNQTSADSGPTDGSDTR